jgi:enoyl-CoA hydratase
VPDLVLYTVRDRAALITVNDPDRRNAVTAAMSAALRAAIERAEADDGVHAVIVTGAGKAFCAGADLGALGAAPEDELLRLYDGSWRSVRARCRPSQQSMARPSGPV